MGQYEVKYKQRQFWCRGYYVDTVGKNTKAIDAYISNQLKEDRLNGQLTIDDTNPFKGYSRVYRRQVTAFSERQL